MQSLYQRNLFFGMMNETKIEEFYENVGCITFKVSDSKKETDSEVYLKIKKNYRIKNQKDISKMEKQTGIGYYLN